MLVRQDENGFYSLPVQPYICTILLKNALCCLLRNGKYINHSKWTSLLIKSNPNLPIVGVLYYGREKSK